MKPFNSGFSIFKVMLVVLASFSLIPIIILIFQSISSLNTSKELSNKSIESTFKEQTTQIYKSYAQNLSKRVSDFLYSCESDLQDLSSVAFTPRSFQLFDNNNLRWVNHLDKSIPLYKEIVLIDQNGNEKIKISQNEIVPDYLLKNVRDKNNTTYLSETYFDDAKNFAGDIYVTHLTSWYISRYEQLVQKKSFDGVIRFCKKLKDKDGKFKGILMLALNYVHMLDFVDYNAISEDSLVKRYKIGSYNYLVDDEGWIIAHQKLWDIKGLNKDGQEVEKLSQSTPSWKYEMGIIPINLLHMDWKLRDINNNEPMSSILERVRRGETAITTMKSMGVYNENEGIIRTRTYAPIFYSSGPYSKYGIFGAVSVGTSLKKFLDNSQTLAKNLDEINTKTKKEMIFIAIGISIGVVFFSFFIARWIAKPLTALSVALLKIGKADYSVGNINSSIEEINILSYGVKNLADELDVKDKKINQTVIELESVNAKLAETKKELSAYLHHEFEIETDVILEEKIKSYEKEYPILKKIRNEKLIGNSPQFLRVLRQIVPQSQMNLPICIYGESGVGKSALAFVLHSLSSRSEKPFLTFEAAEFSAADPMIVMGKLFGYGFGHGIAGIDKEGQNGILESCEGGTLLIDDVEALPLETQAQILRVVDGLSFHPAAGKSREIHSDLRFLFATHINLEQYVKEGLFRKDLFRRIGGSFNRIEIPPLRDRKSDILMIAEYFLNRFNQKNNTAINLTQVVKNHLLDLDYKEGNIGELKILIEVSYENARVEGNEFITEKYFPILKKEEKKVQIDRVQQINNGLFNQDELRKLEILRNNFFRMDISEEELGFKKGSHTLSHHLKGMCLKALCSATFDVGNAAQLIIGPNNNNKQKPAIIQKIEGYILNVREKFQTENEAALQKNLPKEYHSYIKETALHFKNTTR